jgi:allantoin racemase
MAIRLWIQSATDLSVYAGFARSIEPHARRVCRPDTEISVHGVTMGNPKGMPSSDAHYGFPPLTRELISLQIVGNAIRAEREKYDAMVVTSFMDVGVDLAQSAVDIPVVGFCSGSLRMASTMGRRLGLISIDRGQMRMVNYVVQRNGFGDLVSGLICIDPPATPEELSDNEGGGGKLIVERFIVAAKRLIDDGADIVIPAEGFLAGLLHQFGITEVAGVPVFDVHGACCALAECLAVLRKASSFKVSRRGAYAKPPNDRLAHVAEQSLRAFSAALEGR